MKKKNFYPLFRPFGSQINFFRIFAQLKPKGGGKEGATKFVFQKITEGSCSVKLKKV